MDQSHSWKADSSSACFRFLDLEGLPYYEPSYTHAVSFKIYFLPQFTKYLVWALANFTLHLVTIGNRTRVVQLLTKLWYIIFKYCLKGNFALCGATRNISVDIISTCNQVYVPSTLLQKNFLQKPSFTSNVFFNVFANHCWQTFCFTLCRVKQNLVLLLIMVVKLGAKYARGHRMKWISWTKGQWKNGTIRIPGETSLNERGLTNVSQWRLTTGNAM